MDSTNNFKFNLELSENNETTSSRVSQMQSIQNEGLELFKRKNQDYGDAFANYGVVGVLVRMGDKIARLQSISTKSVSLVDSESLRDTLIDLHNYSAMAIMLLDEDDMKKMRQQLDILKEREFVDQDLDATTRHPNPPPPTPRQASRPKW
uniref:Nucleotide modification associated domain-containing protein n=1 Tax=viral metagenome TaxID=1070528 RepID=A0A6C0H3U9_9ZZZZ